MGRFTLRKADWDKKSLPIFKKLLNILVDTTILFLYTIRFTIDRIPPMVYNRLYIDIKKVMV